MNDIITNCKVKNGKHFTNVFRKLTPETIKHTYQADVVSFEINKYRKLRMEIIFEYSDLFIISGNK